MACSRRPPARGIRLRRPFAMARPRAAFNPNPGSLKDSLKKGARRAAHLRYSVPMFRFLESGPEAHRAELGD